MSANGIQAAVESRFISIPLPESKPAPTPARGPAGLRLAHYAITGWLSSDHDPSGPEPLAEVVSLCADLAPEFIARVAVAAHQASIVRDTPAALLAVLASRDLDLFEKTFPRVVTTFADLSRFIAIITSGVAGRRSLGSRPRRLVRQWLAVQSEHDLLAAASLPTEPSLARVIGMAHPKPDNLEREALYGRLLASR